MTAPRKTSTAARRANPRIPQPVIPPPDELQATWAPPRPYDDSWTPRPWVTIADRAAYGKLARQVSPREPRRVRARGRPRPDRDPDGPGSGPAAGAPGAAPRAYGGGGFPLLPRHPGRHGLRPGLHAPVGHHRPGQRRCSPLKLRALRLARADTRVRRQRFRRDAARALGMGRQASRREHRDRRSGEWVQRETKPRRDHGNRPQLPPVDGALRRHAVAWTSGTRRSRTSASARRPKRAACSRDAPQPVADSGWKRSSARPASATACVPSSR